MRWQIWSRDGGETRTTGRTPAVLVGLPAVRLGRGRFPSLQVIMQSVLVQDQPRLRDGPQQGGSGLHRSLCVDDCGKRSDVTFGDVHVGTAEPNIDIATNPAFVIEAATSPDESMPFNRHGVIEKTTFTALLRDVCRFTNNDRIGNLRRWVRPKVQRNQPKRRVCRRVTTS